MKTAILLGGKKIQENTKNVKTVKKEVCFLCKPKPQKSIENIQQEYLKL